MQQVRKRMAALLWQDVVRRYKETHTDFEAFPDKVAFQLNDTHPTVAVAELMRVLMDENKLGWTASWDVTTKVPPPCSCSQIMLSCKSRQCVGHLTPCRSSQGILKPVQADIADASFKSCWCDIPHSKAHGSKCTLGKSCMLSGCLASLATQCRQRCHEDGHHVWQRLCCCGLCTALS